MMRALFLSSLFAASLGAQITADLPVVLSPTNQNIPLSVGIGRYQQWYPSPGLQGEFPEPMRFTQVQFLAGVNSNPVGAQLSIEVLIGHGKFSQVTGNFDTNWDDTPVVAVPTTFVTMTPAPTGQPAITLPFQNLFTWDRFRPILLEVRIYSNNQGSQAFNYEVQGTNILIGQTSRVWASGSPGAVNGSVGQGRGLITRFTARSGVMMDFGTGGCPGEGGFVPVNNPLQIPSPSISWNNQLTNAPSGRLAFWVVGGTEIPPVDLGPLFGLGLTNCNLMTDPVNIIGPIQTVGGGPGGGFAQLDIPLPGIPFQGLQMFTQWVIFDPSAPSGAFAVTGGKFFISAPPGG